MNASAKDIFYDIDILARTLYGECEGKNLKEAEAIASVVMNRVHHPRWKVSSAAGACLQPLQFSCWNSNDPNRSRILKAGDSWFLACQKIATAAVNSHLQDPTCGATHYYLDAIAIPRWARGKKPCFVMKHKNGSSHLFFNNIDTKAPDVCAKAALDQDRPLASTRTIQAGTVAGASALTSVVADLNDVKDQLAPLAWYNEHLQLILVVLTLVGIGVMIWARVDDRRKGKR